MYNATNILKAISPDPRCCERLQLPQHRTEYSSTTRLRLRRLSSPTNDVTTSCADDSIRSYRLRNQHVLRRFVNFEFEQEFDPKFRNVFDATKMLIFVASIDRFRSVSSLESSRSLTVLTYEFTALLLYLWTPMWIVWLSDKNFLDSWENRDQIGGQRSRDVFSDDFQKVLMRKNGKTQENHVYF